MSKDAKRVRRKYGLGDEDLMRTERERIPREKALREGEKNIENKLISMSSAILPKRRLHSAQPNYQAYHYPCSAMEGIAFYESSSRVRMRRPYSLPPSSLPNDTRLYQNPEQVHPARRPHEGNLDAGDDEESAYRKRRVGWEIVNELRKLSKSVAENKYLQIIINTERDDEVRDLKCWKKTGTHWDGDEDEESASEDGEDGEGGSNTHGAGGDVSIGAVNVPAEQGMAEALCNGVTGSDDSGGSIRDSGDITWG
ncbi:hypothetical protein BJ165DRAFT_1407877 [Panaeolus papilionaceus]|nr:hypothetical protein BJ165DRAFT_1407877 [Panaeolus papilionaceus]